MSEFKNVPVEPTDEMIKAARLDQQQIKEFDYSTRDSFVDIYKAMISAAPTQPPPAESDKEAVRNAALEEIAGHLDKVGLTFTSHDIRQMKSHTSLLSNDRDTSANPAAWAAIHCSGKNKGKIYNTCETKEQIDKYIEDVHRSNDHLTLRARPLIYCDSVNDPQPAQPSDTEMLDWLLSDGDTICEMTDGSFEYYDYTKGRHKGKTPREAIKAAMQADKEGL